MTYDLDQLEKLHREATPGPWTEQGLEITDREWTVEISGPSYGDAPCISVFTGASYEATEEAPLNDGNAHNDAELIAAMRNALPELLADATLGRRIRAMREQIESDGAVYDAPVCEQLLAAIDGKE